MLGLLFLFTPIPGIGAVVVGVAYPIYASVISIRNGNVRSTKWWLIYFFMYAMIESLLVNLVEPWASWIPFFYHTKLIFVIWLQLPLFRGAQTIFMGAVAQCADSSADSTANSSVDSSATRSNPADPGTPTIFQDQGRRKGRTSILTQRKKSSGSLSRRAIIAGAQRAAMRAEEENSTKKKL